MAEKLEVLAGAGVHMHARSGARGAGTGPAKIRTCVLPAGFYLLGLLPVNVSVGDHPRHGPQAHQQAYESLGCFYILVLY